jgi:hypothetical protein
MATASRAVPGVPTAVPGMSAAVGDVPAAVRPWAGRRPVALTRREQVAVIGVPVSQGSPAAIALVPDEPVPGPQRSEHDKKDQEVCGNGHGAPSFTLGPL